MSFARVEHALHEKRKGRNRAVALCLVSLIGLLVALTMVKYNSSGSVEAFDHAPRNSLVPDEASQ